MNQPVVDIGELSAAERLELLEKLWDSLDDASAELPLTDPQRAELDRRLDALETDVANGRVLGIPWTEVLEQLRTHR